MNCFALRSNIIPIILCAVLLTCGSAFGQSSARPLLQDIQIVGRSPAIPSATPYVEKTSSASPTNAGVVSANSTLASVSVPGYSGIIVESLDGNRIYDSNSKLQFNPASNVKIATAYAILKTFGPEFRFMTNIYTDGVIDRRTGTLNGNVYVSGRDPIFGYEHAVAIAYALNRMGIRTVNGDMVATDNFVMNYSGSSLSSGSNLFSTLDASQRSPSATRAWLNHVTNAGKFEQMKYIPSVTFSGAAYVQSIPSSLTLLFTHESAPMREILKVTLCYSNNFLAERLGDMLGGAYAVARIVQLNAGISPAEFSIQTSSGLGYNRVTPDAMIKLLRTLRNDLAKYKMTFADIMPVAGIDKGTLEGRFDSDFATGSVVGKTGTLVRTDGGVSALAGEMHTRNGTLLFVIFNQRGGVPKFRSFQNYFVSLIQGQLGGAQPIPYAAVSLDSRMARSRITRAN